jgi:hypothetical protein
LVLINGVLGMVPPGLKFGVEFGSLKESKSIKLICIYYNSLSFFSKKHKNVLQQFRPMEPVKRDKLITKARKYENTKSEKEKFRAHAAQAPALRVLNFVFS